MTYKLSSAKSRSLQLGLRNLKSQSIVACEKIGVRNLVCAVTGRVIPLGYHLYEHYEFRGNPENFHRNVPRINADVYYQGSRAELVATVGFGVDQGRKLDISSHFPVNLLARQLFQAPTSKSRNVLSLGDELYGGAFLITDIRPRWVLPCIGMTKQAFKDLSDDLLSKNSPGYMVNGRPWKIVFEDAIDSDDQTLIGLKFQGSNGP